MVIRSANISKSEEGRLAHIFNRTRAIVPMRHNGLNRVGDATAFQNHRKWNKLFALLVPIFLSTCENASGACHRSMTQTLLK